MKETRTPFLVTPFGERAPTFSPNGRWIAYASSESGRDEVYVRSYPLSSARLTVSSNGGDEPVWSRDGRELFYRNADRMFVVSVTGDASLTLSAPRQLFQGTYLRDPSAAAAAIPNYDVTPDGRAFIMVQQGAEMSIIVVVENWFEELKRLVPVD